MKYFDKITYADSRKVLPILVPDQRFTIAYVMALSQVYLNLFILQKLEKIHGWSPFNDD